MQTLLGLPIRMICDEPAEGAWNMAVDQALAMSAAQPVGRPVIRLYGFSSPTVSIGRFQPITDLLRDRMRSDGIRLVRRPTGGRAVLHDAEVTYAVALGTDHLKPFTKRRVYRVVGDLLLTALTDLGVDCRRNEVLIGDSADPNCFGSVAKYELVGRFGKLVGSAQMITRFGSLQHGSIPLDDSYRRVTDYLAKPNATDAAGTSWLSRETGQPASFTDVLNRLQRSLATTLVPMEMDSLEASETQLVATLLPQFMSPSWTLSGKP